MHKKLEPSSVAECWLPPKTGGSAVMHEQPMRLGSCKELKLPLLKASKWTGNSSSLPFLVYEHAELFVFFHNRLISHLQKPSTLSVFAVEKNPCQTNPCLHGGSCLQEGDGYSCYCPQGFSGESCEIGESLPGQQCAGKPRRLAAVGCLVTVS